MSDLRMNIRQIVRGAYDIQELRIAMGNRIAAAFRTKLGVVPGTKEQESDAEAQKILKRIRDSYYEVTEGYVSWPTKKKFKGNAIISDHTELVLVAEWIELVEQEKRHFSRLKSVVEEHPLWTRYLKDVRGVGPAMTGVIISEFDIHKAKYPSSMWAYAGLDVAEDGAGRSKRQEHLINRTYIAADGTEKTKRSITFNPFLRTKLLGVLGTSFIKQPADKCKYRKIYDDYKHRLNTSPKWAKEQRQLAEKAKKEGKGYAPVAHTHYKAVRYMIKVFVQNLYNVWRRLENLPVAPTYAEAKLGLTHNVSKEYAKYEQ